MSKSLAMRKNSFDLPSLIHPLSPIEMTLENYFESCHLLDHNVSKHALTKGNKLTSSSYPKPHYVHEIQHPTTQALSTLMIERSYGRMAI